MKHSLSIRRPHVKSKWIFSWTFDAAASTVFIPYTAKLLPTELIKINCVQYQYHWHGPLELMNQMTSGVLCSTQRVICPWTNMQSRDLLVGGTGEGSLKGSSVTWFCYLVLADNYSIWGQIFHISSFSRPLALVPVFFSFLLSLPCIFLSPSCASSFSVHSENNLFRLTGSQIALLQIFPSSHYCEQRFHICITSSLMIWVIVIFFSFDAF